LVLIVSHLELSASSTSWEQARVSPEVFESRQRGRKARGDRIQSRLRHSNE